MPKINLILPKMVAEIDFNEEIRLYFLGGPIQSSGHWQTMALEMLSRVDPGCYVACPHEYNINHWIFKACAQLACENPKNSLEFPNQTLWKRYYLQRASYYGTVIMWLPCEDPGNPHTDGNTYAQDTRGEIGEWRIKAANPHVFSFERGKMRRHFHRVNLVVGAEPDFPGLKTIQENFDDEFGRPYLIHNTLKETINTAVSLAKSNTPNTKFFQTT